MTDRLPPITALAVGSISLVIVGGIYMTSYLPRPAPLGPAVGLLVAAGVLLGAACGALARLRSLAWGTFFLVGRWTLLVYFVLAGMLEYVFVLDGTRGATLVLLTLMLAVFALDIPMLLAFSVARYREAETPG
ncbi:MAG: hypothetical protein ACRDZ5_08740 [Acidimicrobiales bacterium]